MIRRGRRRLDYLARNGAPALAHYDPATPADVTLQELALETFLPADAQTAAALQRWVRPA